MIRQTTLLCACMTLLAGCVGFEYDGGTETPETQDVAVFSQPNEIRRTYRVFGKATVSGDYNDVSRDRLLAKLKSEAQEKGADAILITEQQVVQESESRSVEPRFGTVADHDGEAGSMRQIQRTLDLDGSMEKVENNARYLRVLKAEFLKYTDGKPQAPEVVEPTPAK